MRALVVDHSRPGHLAQSSVPVPVPGPHQALVQVTAAAVNPGDLSRLADAPDGTVPGWEAAGVVTVAAADGSGPAVGTRVLTLGADGAWAHLRTVDTDLVGAVPAGVDLVEATALPVAAASALRSLRRLGPLLGRRVLVTGASGAVGRLAVQLAVAGGADVLASTRTSRAAADLRALGAEHVLAGDLGAVPAVHGVIDTVGGASLVVAFGRLAADGVLVSVGRASGEPSRLGADDLLGDAGRHGRSLTTFFLADGSPGLGSDLTWLAQRLVDGRLDVGTLTRVPWPAPGDEHLLVQATGGPGKVVVDLAGAVAGG